MKLRIFTWNMARGRSMVDRANANSDDRKRADARYGTLMELCKSSDIGFIQEAGADLHGPVRSGAKGPVPIGLGAWRASMRADYQTGASPCRSLIFSNVGRMQSVHLEFLSGGAVNDQGFTVGERYPAAAIVTINRKRILLVSFHATSGPNGAENTLEFQNFVETYARTNRLGIDAVLVGGDFNCEMLVGMGSPPSPTHQNGRAYDGFYRHRPKDSRLTRATVQNPRVYHMPGWRVLRTRPLPEASIGFFTRFGRDKLTKVSDHAPVLAAFEFF